LSEVTRCIKLNYEVHGNIIPHFHMHLFPRYPGDPFEGRALDASVTEPSPYAPGEHAAFVSALNSALDSIAV
jgi:diadenosine tetraphosphate (Ap4A) HIT family hydrolase